MIVEELAASGGREWDEYVDAHSLGTPFHLIAWKRSIEETFRFESCYLVARNGGVLQGVLPLFHVRNPIIGSALISSPFAVYGGILSANEEAKAALAGHAAALGQRLGVQYIDLRNAWPEQCSSLPRVDRYVTFVQRSSPGTGEELLAATPKKTRNLIRKSLKHPFSSRICPHGTFDSFWELYSRNLRRLGTPCFPRRFFSSLLQNFGPIVDVREILFDGRVAAASFNFLYRDSLHTYYAASDRDMLEMAPNNFMYYDHILWAGNNGYTQFDFGRSKHGTGTFDFKRHWNTEMRELPYEMILVKRKSMPNFSPANSKFHLAIGVWRRLPLGVTRWLGPHLVRMFP